jgi:type IV secretory pathway VirB2 component (pilin)
MSIGNGVKNEVTVWVGLGLLIAISMILLAKFKESNTTSTAANTSIDKIITGIGEPANWLVIIIICIVGFAIIKLTQSKAN